MFTLALDTDVEEAVEAEAAVKVATKKPAVTKSETPKVHWAKQKPKYSTQPINSEKKEVSQLVEKLIAKTERELFEEFFDNKVIQHITHQSMKYATQQNRHGFDFKPYQRQRFL